MADEELIATGLEVLEDFIAMLIEDAHEAAVSATPADPSLRLARAQELRQAGADMMALANACEVLIRRGAPLHSSDE